MTLFDDTFSHLSLLIKFELIKGRKECGMQQASEPMGSKVTYIPLITIYYFSNKKKEIDPKTKSWNP